MLILDLFRFLRSGLYYYLLKRKWLKLYSVIGISEFNSYKDLKKNLGKNELIKIKEKSSNILKKIRKKKDILNIKIDEINMGELIYDTYIRYRNEININIKDKYLEEIIYKSIILSKSLTKFIRKKKIFSLYLPYTSFVSHGVPAKVGVKLNLPVYTNSGTQYNKLINSRSFSHEPDINNLKKIFKNKKNKSEKLLKSKKLIEDYFSVTKKSHQKRLYYWLSLDSYKGKKISKNIDQKNNYEIVIFLPNFFETQRSYGKIVFTDFYDWITYTLDYFVNKNITVAIKSHPNLDIYHQDNKDFLEILKKKYNQFIWLDPMTPNKEIFKKIKFGISPLGTILWELAYFNINCLSIGDHPGKQFNISFIPKNLKHYKYYLDNYDKLKNKVSKKEIYEFIYVHLINNNDHYKNLARKIDLKKIDCEKSSSLEIFLERYKNYKN